MREKVEVVAVRDRDLRTVLSQYGLDVAIDRSELLCPICSCVLTWDNIGAFKANHGNITIYCESAECLGIAQEEKSDDN